MRTVQISRTVMSIVGLVSVLAYAGAQGTAFTYQGFLKVSGNPANASYDFQFSLWTAASGGTQVGTTQTLTNVPVQNGLFTVTLDFGAVWDGSDRYLEIAVRPAGSGSYTTLSPRVKINPTPYAIRAGWAGVANPIGAAGGDLSGSYPNPTVARLQGRAVSIAAPSAGQVLKWNGTAWEPATDDGLILPFSGSVSQSSGAVFSVTNTATSGANYSGYFRSDSTSGTAVYGYAAATSGVNNGGYFRSDSTVGNGVYGHAAATSGEAWGVLGQSNSTSGTGVYGWATATSGTTYGVRGIVNSPSGWAGYFVGRGYFSGDVGIGTTSPAAKLDVSGTVRMTGFQLTTSPAAGYVLTSDASGNGTWQPVPNYWSASGSHIYNNNAGNVGIGTSSPTHRLTIQSSDQETTRLVGPGSFGSQARLNFGDADYVYLEEDADDRLTIYASLRTAIMGGNVGIGTTTPAAKLDVNGTARVQVLEITGADLAEKFPTTETLEPGTVVEIDPDNPGHLRKARGAYNKRVAGVVAGANGLSKGIILGNLEGSENHTPIAISGRVWVYADATHEAIEPGDFLTTSDTPGYAMKASNLTRAQGAILGKAMSRLEKGKRGLVLVLVNLQ